MKAAALGLLVLAAAVAGCTEGEGAGTYGGAGGGATVSNHPGSFYYSAGGAQSGTHTYRWENPTGRAHVAYSGGGAGSVSVRITDAMGHPMFSRSFSGAGGGSESGMAGPGVPGAWHITLSARGAGGFTLSVQSA